MNNQHTVFIGNLPFSTQKSELQEVFEKFGSITEIHIPVDRQTGKSRGFAFVTFETEEASQAALEMNGQEMNGRTIKVHMAHGKKETAGGGGAPRSGGFRSGGDRGGERRGGSSNGGGFGGGFRSRNTSDGGNRW
jgi:cold-inducible RNA-binding protein